MLITSAAQAVEIRDRAAHKFHLIQNRTTDPGAQQMLREVAADLRALDVWVTTQVAPQHPAGVVVPLDGDNKGNP